MARTEICFLLSASLFTPAIFVVGEVGWVFFGGYDDVATGDDLPDSWLKESSSHGSPAMEDSMEDSSPSSSESRGSFFLAEPNQLETKENARMNQEDQSTTRRQDLCLVKGRMFS